MTIFPYCLLLSARRYCWIRYTPGAKGMSTASGLQMTGTQLALFQGRTHWCPVEETALPSTLLRPCPGEQWSSGGGETGRKARSGARPPPVILQCPPHPTPTHHPHPHPLPCGLTRPLLSLNLLIFTCRMKVWAGISGLTVFPQASQEKEEGPWMLCPGLSGQTAHPKPTFF